MADPELAAPELAAPRITVVVPCYDLGRYLDEAVASCLLQTYQGFEIVVVDDGSTDAATRALLDDYRRPKTRLIRTSNRGLGPARNRGAREATGELLCFLDADDRLAPTYFEKALGAFDADPELTFVSCWIEAFGEESWIYRPERCDLEAVLADCTVATPALVRRPAFEAVGGFDEAMPEPGDEDWDLWIRLLAAGGRGTILPEVLFHYRRRSGSMVEHCYYGPAHLVLMEYLYRKHAPLYRRHLDAVLSAKAREAAELEANRQWLERHLAGELVPAVESRRRQLLAGGDG